MNLSKFSSQSMSKAEMKAVKGGLKWCYAYDCTCGSVSYNGWGDLSQYRSDAQASCASGVPVNCSFSDPGASCGS